MLLLTWPDGHAFYKRIGIPWSRLARLKNCASGVGLPGRKWDLVLLCVFVEAHFGVGGAVLRGAGYA